MKKMILSLLVLALSTSAFGGNEGPQAAPQPPGKTPTVLVERADYGGFMVPPGVVNSRELQILENGNVVKIESIRGEGPGEAKLITRLTDEQLAKVVKLVNAIKPGKLVDPDPRFPGCMDAPSSYDAVYKAGVQIKIAQKVNCKNLQRAAAGKADAQLIKALDALEKMADKQ